VSAPTSLEQVIESEVDLASHSISNPIPNAEPKPVAIALIIVAEPGDLTVFFIIEPHHKVW
jgi:hypothetical protein